MRDLNISPGLENKLSDFLEGLKNIFTHDLISVILYGSAASREFVDKHSNLNVLVVLSSSDLEDLKKASGLVAKLKTIIPLFLNESYIANSTDIFPIEFLDMRENYRVLFGKDLLKDITVDTKNLRFQCEQELKSKLINLRQLYLNNNKNKSALVNSLFRYFTSILHILRNVLRLKGKPAPYKKEEIIDSLGREFKIDVPVWKRILSVKQKKAKLKKDEIEPLFVVFVRELEKITDEVDRL